MRCRAVSVHSGCGRLSVRLTAMAVCALFVLALLLASAFVLTHANHDHDHNGEDGGCAACAQIAVAADFLSRGGAAAVVVAGVIGGLSGAYALIKIAAPRYVGFTLISLKIRLNI